ncbi:hypothetical protein HaLaN_19282, partial [Haematococcus lacustris]
MQGLAPECTDSGSVCCSGTCELLRIYWQAALVTIECSSGNGTNEGTPPGIQPEAVLEGHRGASNDSTMQRGAN